VTRPAPDTQAIGPNAEARGHDPAAGHSNQDHGHRDGHGCTHGHGAGHHLHHDGDCHGHRGGHHHDHGHGHHHGVAPRLAGDALSRAFAWAVALNVGFVIAEFAFGLWANSTALLADAGHNLSDVLGLLLAWGAVYLGRRRASPRYTYGLRGSSILAALANAGLLLAACGAIAWEAVGRMMEPPPVASGVVIAVAAAGILVNGLSAWLFSRGREHDLNVRGAYLHLMADAAVSLGVVVSGVAMALTGWYRLDPIVTLAIVGVIAWSTWGLLREAVAMSLNAVPAHLDPAEVTRYLAGQPGVAGVHDLHVWSLSTTDCAMTAHLVMPAGHPGDAVLDALAAGLRERFDIGHATLQVEYGTTDHGACALQEHGDRGHA
jgi:cobalt-zinc-cadmium efflux system protein